MTLIFSGNNYKYEIEGIMKLFIPATRFKHIYSDEICESSDYVFVSEKQERDEIVLLVKADHMGKTVVKEQRLSLNDSTDRELLLSKLLFLAMKEITGIVPKWGVMTGVRPVKRVNRFLDKGLSKEQIRELFRDEFFCSEEKFELAYKTAEVQRNFLSAPDDRSFSLYVSIPFCPTRCSYCSFISQTLSSGKKLIPEYISNLCREIRYTGELADKLGLKLDTVYFGGGTPTSFEADQLALIMKTVSDSFDMSTVREYTVEAGRPDTITEEKLSAVRENGCTRLSVNPQTLNDDVLRAIGRKHTSDQFYEAMDLAVKAGFEHINTDIIAGLPSDTPESFASTIEGLIRLSPADITVHTLSIKRAADLNYSDDKSLILANPSGVMVDHASKELSRSGYHPYYLYRQKNMLENLENIGWSKPGYESLYNIFIMEEIQTIIAVGAGASSKLVDLKGERLERIFNYKHPLEYNKHFELMLDKKKEILEFYAEEK